MDQLIAKYSEAQTGTHHPHMAASGSTCQICYTRVRVRVCVCCAVCRVSWVTCHE
jgi:hypothetical protein